jgi:L,D-peptidoglycan transpeptidase YkuD (ErfK/YbiS/YcfS/YnhG family)
MDFPQMPSQVDPLEPKGTGPITAFLTGWPASLKRSLTQCCSRSLLLFCVALGTLFLPAIAAPVLHREVFALRDSTQLLVVTTPEWNAVSGVLRRYERSSTSGAWEAVGHPIGVVVGKGGLGWDAGTELADTPGVRNLHDPVKKEGDLRSPAGIFRLGTTFGYAPERPDVWRMPYLSLTSSIECVDDPKSKFYNQVLDRTAVSPDWKSSEHMLRSDDMYRWGLVVEQNVDPAVPGNGSCIFLHIWPKPGQGTVGCTATAEQQIEVVLGWLDSAQSPVLVQMPTSKYVALEKAWGLPAIP